MIKAIVKQKVRLIKNKMNNKKIPLQQGCYYHIYNRGNNRQNIFFENENYTYFLDKLDQYISPVCDVIS